MVFFPKRPCIRPTDIYFLFSKCVLSVLQHFFLSSIHLTHFEKIHNTRYELCSKLIYFLVNTVQKSTPVSFLMKHHVHSINLNVCRFLNKSLFLKFKPNKLFWYIKYTFIYLVLYLIYVYSVIMFIHKLIIAVYGSFSLKIINIRIVTR